MFDIFAPELIDDPFPGLADLRATDPVHRVRGTDVFLVTSWDLVQEVVADPATYSSHLRRVLIRTGDGGASTLPLDGGGTVEQVLATADAPVHGPQRAAVLGTIGRRIRALESSVDEQVDDLWRRWFAAGTSDGTADWAADMADRLPLALVAQLIGLDPDDVTILLRWAYDSTEMLGGWVDADRLATTVQASLDLHAYLRDRFEQALGSPGDNLMGELATACRAGTVAPTTAVLTLLQLVGAGGESTAGLIGTAGLRIASDPVLQDRLRRDPALLDPFLDECLRLESPFRGHYRSVTRPTRLGDTELPGDSTVLLMWGAANRDPGRFDHPDELDLDRPQVRQHLAFGRGTHFCVGSALARMEATAAVRALLDRTSHVTLEGPDAATWASSIFVRRLTRLQLRLTKQQ